MVWPAVIAAGASLAGSAMGAFSNKGGSTKSTAEARGDYLQTQREQQQYDNWRAREEQQYYALAKTQQQVTSAKRAGVHPLFALGNAVSPPTMGGSGNIIDSGISAADPSGRVGDALASGVAGVADAYTRQKENEKADALQERQLLNTERDTDARIRLADSEARRNDFVVASEKQSLLKRAGQKANHKQDVFNPPPGAPKPQTRLKTPFGLGDFPIPRGETAETYEKYYGDIGSLVGGAANLVDSAAGQAQEWYAKMKREALRQRSAPKLEGGYYGP